MKEIRTKVCKKANAYIKSGIFVLILDKSFGTFT